jgi:sulfate permease, SulP family
MDTEHGEPRAVSTSAVTVARGITSQPKEYTALLSGPRESNPTASKSYNSIEDVEGQRESLKANAGGIRDAIARTKKRGYFVFAKISSPQTWNKQVIWTYGVRQPVGYVPAVVLGLLLNILDALSYGDCEPISSR